MSGLVDGLLFDAPDKVPNALALTDGDHQDSRVTSQSAQPDTACDVAEFVSMLRTLKDQSGLTLRGLEERATAQGEVLARSTVADMLRKDSLPRPELLAVYVRACGVEQPAPWLGARERLAIGVGEVVDVPEQGEPASSRSLWRRPSTVLAAVVAVALVVAALLMQRDPPETTAVVQTTAVRTTAVGTTAVGTTAVGSTGPGQTTAVEQTVEPRP